VGHGNEDVRLSDYTPIEQNPVNKVGKGKLRPLSAEYAWVSRKPWSLSEPASRLILPVLVTETCLEDFAFLACSIDL
jgi:hypothetical protein